MKKISLLCLFAMLFTWYNLSSQTEYYSVQLKFNDKFSQEDFTYYGFDSESSVIRDDVLEFIADNGELKLLESLGADFQIISSELTTEYLMKYAAYFSQKRNTDVFLSDIGFRLGSMNGYFTLDETYQQFDSLISNYYEYWVSTDTIGFSVNNLPIIAYKFGSVDNYNEVLLTSLHHAREPGGASAIIYFMNDLLHRGRAGDEQAAYLLDNRTIYIIPVVNPDGLLFNQQNSPNGGGLWRKNRKKINDSTWGVDLNRNYGPYELWNAQINGSSTKPSDVTYRGSEPFSEPETRAVRDFVLDKNIKLCMNFHTYGNLLIYPFSALARETEDSTLFRDWSRNFTKQNRYLSGLDKQTVNYSGRGVTDDWLYWTDSLKLNKTYSFTPEVGKLSDNFWTTPDRILEQCRENLDMLYSFLWSAEVNWVLESYEMNDDNSNKLNLKLKNIGLQKDLENLTLVILNSLDKDFYIEKNAEVNFRDLKAIEASIKSTKPIQTGYSLPVEIVITVSGVSRRDTISVRLGQPGYISLFQDEELFGKWDMGDWNLETDASKNKFVLTDSPKGYYSNSDTNYIQMTEPILLDFNAAELLFESYWEIEPNYDFGTVEISSDSALTWKKLDAPRMIYGQGIKESVIQPNETGYSGYSNRWEKVKIPLTEFTGKKILLRFGLLTDKASNADGWKLDNIRIRVYVNNTDVSENRPNLSVLPNPSFVNEPIKFVYPGILDIMNVTDYLGNRIEYNYDAENNMLNIESASVGIFFVSIRQQGQIRILKIVRI